MFFPNVYEARRDLIAEDSVVRIKARVENSDRGTKLLPMDVEPLVGRRDRPRRAIGAGAGCDRAAERLLRHYPGKDVLEIHVDGIGKTTMFRMPAGVNKDSGVSTPSSSRCSARGPYGSCRRDAKGPVARAAASRTAARSGEPHARRPDTGLLGLLGMLGLIGRPPVL